MRLVKTFEKVVLVSLFVIKTVLDISIHYHFLALGNWSIIDFCHSKNKVLTLYMKNTQKLKLSFIFADCMLSIVK